MKIRNGFVSNSSSSSFIIGLVNTGKEGNGEIFDPKNVRYPLSLDTKYDSEGNVEYVLKIESFNGDEVSCKIKEDERFIYLDGTGPDGDEAFSYYDSDGSFYGYDYDVDINDFDCNDIDTYNDIVSKGGEVSYGAGRDG